MHEAASGRFCCKSRFALVVENSAGPRCDFRVKMWGTSSPHVKLTGDLANVSDAIRIGDCFPFRNFTKNQSPCNFRLLQQYRAYSDHRLSGRRVHRPQQLRFRQDRLRVRDHVRGPMLAAGNVVVKQRLNLCHALANRKHRLAPVKLIAGQPVNLMPYQVAGRGGPLLFVAVASRPAHSQQDIDR
jgi:hypothetical protein